MKCPMDKMSNEKNTTTSSDQNQKHFPTSLFSFRRDENQPLKNPPNPPPIAPKPTKTPLKPPAKPTKTPKISIKRPKTPPKPQILLPKPTISHKSPKNPPTPPKKPPKKKYKKSPVPYEMPITQTDNVYEDPDTVVEQGGTTSVCNVSYEGPECSKRVKRN